MLTAFCQRWTRRRCTWRPAGEPFDPRAFEVVAVARPGQHRYLLPLTRAARKAAGASLPYPRVSRAALDACPTFDGGPCVSPCV